MRRRTSATVPARRPAPPTPTTTRAATTTWSSCPAGPARSACSTRSSARRAPTADGGSYGAGDHWTGTPGAARSTRPVVGHVSRSTTPTARLANTGDDGSPVATLTVRPGQRHAGRLQWQLRDAREPGRRERPGLLHQPGPQRSGCRWPTGLSAGHLSPQRQHHVATPPTSNVGAENLFSIWVQSGGNARVYGSGRMAAYTNLDGGKQAFYFAQIEKDPRRQDDGHPAVRPGRVVGQRLPALPEPRRQRLQLRDVRLGLRRRPVGHRTSRRSRPRSTGPPSSTTASSRSDRPARRPTAAAA